MKRFRTNLGRVLLIVAVLLALCTAAAAADRSAATPTEFYQAVFDNLTAQNGSFSIEYTGSFRGLGVSGLNPEPSAIVRAMAANLPNNDGTGADTAMLNISEAACHRQGNELHFTISYLQDADQLNWVDGKADEILASLQLADATDYMKIKKIYQYMGTNFQYDHSLTKFTDYDGITTGEMVCQGYALLTYKLMWKAGVPCRIMVGFSSGESHGWNIVKLDGKWYNLDTTWDAKSADGSSMYWNYFLKSDAEFSGHERDERFLTNGFYAVCPMALESYSVPTVDIIIDGSLTSMLTIRNGVSIQLDTLLTPEKTTAISWTSSDPAVATISDSGYLTSLTPGEIYITATAADETYTDGSLPVIAVDLRTCSDWASDELNSLYLRKLYPASLCSDYTQGITRAELARLIATFVASNTDGGGSYHYQNFKDTLDNPDWYSIVYCASRGIFDGTGKETFSPDGIVTREQAAKIFCSMIRFMKLNTAASATRSFADDGEISPWARQYVAEAVATGVMEGTGENFEPSAPVSREMAGVMLERIFVSYLEK